MTDRRDPESYTPGERGMMIEEAERRDWWNTAVPVVPPFDDLVRWYDESSLDDRRKHFMALLNAYGYKDAESHRQYDQNVEYIRRIAALEDEINGLRGFKNSVDEALNSGDGSYRP